MIVFFKYQICEEYREYLNGDQLDLDQVLEDDEQCCCLLAQLLQEYGVPGKVLKVKCAVHTLQLVVRDGLNGSNVMKIIQICRIAVKLLRKPKIYNEAREKELLTIRPRNDCPTRWSSTFLMVIRFN